MPAHPAPATTPAKVRVVVTDAPGLHRVVTMLMGRQHAFTRLEAEEAGGGRWTVNLDLVATEHEIDLVTSRLHRLPSVLTVGVTTPAALAVSA
ncbi:hypothetical protein [Modestobacter versicolor]|nr:hypothetical protein [Modestobacter versicolor]MBB3674875.1 acetolactate synthase regulatory subunit [Modestobacter versicolor]